MIAIASPLLQDAERQRPGGIVPDRYERLLAICSLLLLAIVIAAMLRGRAHWGEVPLVVWLHLATILVGTALTPVILLGVRGTRRHRQFGWVWAIAMWTSAWISLFVRLSRHGGFSIIHILSLYVIIQMPFLVWNARRHRVSVHRRQVRAMITGAVIVAGFFTLPFGRMLGTWLTG